MFCLKFGFNYFIDAKFDDHFFIMSLGRILLSLTLRHDALSENFTLIK